MYESSVYHEFHKFRQANEKLSILNRPFRDFFPIYAKDYKTSEYILSNLRLTVISSSGRRLIITSTGYFGEATQPGDVIAVLIRCSFPVVLCPRSKFYKVVGEYYVHSLMDGEDLDLERAGKCFQRLFMLC